MATFTSIYLGRDVKKYLSTQLSLFLEVRKLLKLQGVAYLEGRFKLNLFLTTCTDKIASLPGGRILEANCRNFHSKAGVGVISDVGVMSVEYGTPGVHE